MKTLFQVMFELNTLSKQAQKGVKTAFFVNLLFNAIFLSLISIGLIELNYKQTQIEKLENHIRVINHIIDSYERNNASTLNLETDLERFEYR